MKMRIQLFAKSLFFFVLSVMVARAGAAALATKSESSGQPQGRPFLFQNGFYEGFGKEVRGFYLYRPYDDLSSYTLHNGTFSLSTNFVLGYHYTSDGKPSWFMSYIQNSPEFTQVFSEMLGLVQVPTSPSVNYSVQIKPATSSAPVSVEIIPFPLKLNWTFNWYTLGSTNSSIFDPVDQFAARVYINTGSPMQLTYKPPGLDGTVPRRPLTFSNLWVGKGIKPRGLAIDMNAMDSEKNELRGILFDYDADGKPIWYETRGFLPSSGCLAVASYEGMWGVYEGGSPLQDEYRSPSFNPVAKAKLAIYQPAIGGCYYYGSMTNLIEVTIPNGEVVLFESFDRHMIGYPYPKGAN